MIMCWLSLLPESREPRCGLGLGDKPQPNCDLLLVGWQSTLFAGMGFISMASFVCEFWLRLAELLNLAVKREIRLPERIFVSS